LLRRFCHNRFLTENGSNIAGKQILDQSLPHSAANQCLTIIQCIQQTTVAVLFAVVSRFIARIALAQGVRRESIGSNLNQFRRIVLHVEHHKMPAAASMAGYCDSIL
jgi:hypothetical protein